MHRDRLTDADRFDACVDSYVTSVLAHQEIGMHVVVSFIAISVVIGAILICGVTIWGAACALLARRRSVTATRAQRNVV